MPSPSSSCSRTVGSRPGRAALLALALACPWVPGASSPAHALAFTFDIVSGATGPSGTPQVGDTVVADLWFDTETEELQAWFLQVTHVGQVALAASQEPFIFSGGALASPLGSPVPNSINAGDATGQYAFTVSPPGFIPPGNTAKFGSITLQLLVPGTVMIEIAPGGAVGGPCGCPVEPPPPITYGSFQVVPEPGTALLVGLGLSLLAAFPRRPRRG